MAVQTTPTSKKERITTPVASDVRQLEIQFNNFLTDFQNSVINTLTGQTILTATTLSRGSTDTQLATTSFAFTIGGVTTAKAAVPTGTAFGALGTIPQDTWGLIAVDIVAAGTITFVSAAANYTTGYATSALAVAANPAATALKARVGYIVIQTKTGNTFVVGTDGLAGGSSGNVAATTTYVPVVSVFDTTLMTANQIATLNGTVLTSANY